MDNVFVESGVVSRRHSLQTFRQRLAHLEEKAAAEGIVYTETQLISLETARRELSDTIEAVETHHPGYLFGQDTMYVGHIKGAGGSIKEPLNKSCGLAVHMR